MLKTLTFTFILLSLTTFSQEKNHLPHKTLKDSVFARGDIIDIPELVYSLSYPITPEIIDSLGPVAEFLNKYPKLKIEIGCHTDSRGSAEKNISLCRFRSQHVWEYLVKEKGINPNRLTYKGYGESRLIIKEEEVMKAKTEKEKGKLHKINRRTELLVTGIQ